MKQKLALANITIPIALLMGLLFAPLQGFYIPPYLVFGLMLYTIIRSFLLFQQQTLFAFLPILLLYASEDLGIMPLDLYAPFASEALIFYLWAVNLQSGQRPWLHPLHILNIVLLVIYVILGSRTIEVSAPALTFTYTYTAWVAIFCAATPLLFVKRWQRPGRFASYWPLFAVLLFSFDLAAEEYVILWITLCSLTSLTMDSYLMTYVDELTGIPGRRALLFRMKTMGSKYSVVMVDVDHFKQFNDKHGHQVGDDVLKTVASLISKTAGATAYRYGGEEFTMLFPKGDPVELAPHVEAARERLANYKLYPKSLQRTKKNRGRTSKPRALSVTASFGLAQHRSGESPDLVLERADKALYSAKANGRNRLVIAKT